MRNQTKTPWSELVRLLVLATILMVFEAGAGEWKEFSGGRWRSLPAAGSGDAGFSAISAAEVGVLFTNVLTDAQGGTNRTLYNGSGVATGDVDGDGLVDVAFTGLNDPLRLYKNVGNWRFKDITASSGIVLSNFHGRGIALVDVTRDGALDLLLTGNDAGLRLFRNNGRGRFSEITSESGISTTDGSLTMAFADVDGNGTVDIYVANNRSSDIRDQGQVQLPLIGGKPAIPAHYRDRLVFTNGQLLEYGEADRLFLNDGNGKFKPSDWTKSFFDEQGQAVTGAPLDWGLTASFRDLNGDGAPDLYVCNDFWTPDRIWINRGNGDFIAAPAVAFRQTSGSSMGVDMADLNGDKRPEIFVVDMLSRLPSWKKRQMAPQAPVLNLPGIITNRPQSLRNTLFLAREDGTYAEVANYAELAASEWAWQPIFLDVDLDGLQDIIVTSGHAHDVQDRDAEARVRARQRNYSDIKDPAERRRQFSADLVENMKLYPELATPVIAFRNEGNLKFRDMTEEWGTDHPGIHHGIATADFDGDGDADLVVSKLNAPPVFFKSTTGAGRIAVRLRGADSNTMALGARVTLRGGAAGVQEQEVIAGGRYLSSSDPLLVFATGDRAPQMVLEIRWRDGSERIIRDIEANRQYEVSQDSALDRAAVEELAATPDPLFEDISEILGHQHHETLYDDLLRQPLLPFRLSQSGPGLAWTDLDLDGWDDLVIGTGAGGALGVFRNNQQGGFERWTSRPYNQPLPRDTTGLVRVTASSGKDVLLVGIASYEDGRTNTASVMQFGTGDPAATAFWRDLPSSIGPIAVADYDADGNLDLFLGARATAGRWPEASGSMLLQQRNGAWNKDEQNVARISSKQGVTAALWVDLSNDGYPELVLAGEWGPLRVFSNNKGILAPFDPALVHATGLRLPDRLSRLTGFWTSVASGDFDRDGRMDLIAGNWGENSEMQASPERPLVLVAGDWSGGAALDLIETVYEPGSNTLTLARPLNEVFSSLPFVAGRYRSFQEYSEASLDQVLGRHASEAKRYEAVTLKSFLLLNRGDRFECRPLPMEAQFAPVFGIGVADFDGDGFEDAFLGQNFFATRPGVPRIDAGRGLLLSGRKGGEFEAASGSEAGIKLYGEQRGVAVADFNQDGRSDVAVGQNGAATHLLKNSGGRPGVRVRLEGAKGNPTGIGAIVRIVQNGVKGASRQIQAGSGYWSSDSPAVVLSVPEGFTPGECEVEVRWNGGRITKHRLDRDASAVVLRELE